METVTGDVQEGLKAGEEERNGESPDTLGVRGSRQAKEGSQTKARDLFCCKGNLGRLWLNHTAGRGRSKGIFSTVQCLQA